MPHVPRAAILNKPARGSGFPKAKLGRAPAALKPKSDYLNWNISLCMLLTSVNSRPYYLIEIGNECPVFATPTSILKQCLTMLNRWDGALKNRLVRHTAGEEFIVHKTHVWAVKLQCSQHPKTLKITRGIYKVSLMHAHMRMITNRSTNG